MNLISSFLFYGHAIFGKSKILNRIVAIFYTAALTPALAYYLKKKHPQLLNLVIRNSLTNNSFNAFLSDIDTFLVIENNYNPEELILSFLSINRLFIMFDSPEVYTEEEFLHLEEIKKSSEWEITDLFWNFRKINWCHQSLMKNSSKLNSYKMNRSMKISFEKILKVEFSKDRLKYSLKDFKYLDKLFPIDSNQATTCCCSGYTETSNRPKIVLELSKMQFLFFNSLLPGESLDEQIKQDITSVYLQNKLTLTIHELYLSRSVLRLKIALKADFSVHLKWCSDLEKSIAQILINLSDNSSKEEY